MDELETVLQAFLTQDPNGNGIADEIPMIGSTTLYCGDAPQWILNNYEYCNDMYFYTYDENAVMNIVPMEFTQLPEQWAGLAATVNNVATSGGTVFFRPLSAAYADIA